MDLAVYIKAFIAALKAFLKNPIQPPMPEPQSKPKPPTISDEIYNLAKSCLGKDIAKTQNELGCAEAISYILNSIKVSNFPLAGYLSTSELYIWLKKYALEVPEGIPGDVIISPTGTSSIGSSHGHVGIVAYHGILSNNSMTGLFDEYYTLDKWEAYYVEKLHFPIIYFRIRI